MINSLQTTSTIKINQILKIEVTPIFGGYWSAWDRTHVWLGENSNSLVKILKPCIEVAKICTLTPAQVLHPGAVGGKFVSAFCEGYFFTPFSHCTSTSPFCISLPPKKGKAKRSALRALRFALPFLVIIWLNEHTCTQAHDLNVRIVHQSMLRVQCV